MAPLPIIDPTPYLPPSLSSPAPLSSEETKKARAKVAQALHEACRDIGFFYLKVDAYLSKEEMEDVLDLGREFFSLPSEEKEKIGLGKSDGVRGYQKLHQNITQGKADHHEGLDLYAPSPYPPRPTTSDPKAASAHEHEHASLTKPNSYVGPGDSQGLASDDGPEGYRPLEGPNLWPSRPAQCRGKMEAWIEKMKVLGMAVMRGMADGLGMSEGEWEELRGMVDDSFWVMRVIGYPPLPQGADGISCGEHKDYGCLTLLHCDPIPDSLQVLARFPPGAESDAPSPFDAASAPAPGADSKVKQSSRTISQPQWISANPQPGCLIINIGEMWELWSGGLYRATTHRVVHRSPRYRVSVPFFFEPNFDAQIRCLDAARRIIEASSSSSSASSAHEKLGGKAPSGEWSETVDLEKKTVYGHFLLQKVGGNFKY